jgi:hypothetical protein
MRICDSCVYDLCDLVICGNLGVLKTPIIAPIAGEYSLVVEYQNNVIKFVQNFNAGESIDFNLENLNENYCYEGSVFSPSHEVLFFDFEEIIYYNFRFCTKSIINGNS